MGPIYSVLHWMDGGGVPSECGKKLGAGGVVTRRRKVRSNVVSIRGYGNRTTEVNLLPTRSRLTGKSRTAEQCTRDAPQVADVGSRIRCALIEADSRNVAIEVGTELDAQFDGIFVSTVCL